MGHYSRRHYDLLRGGPPDTPEIIAERMRYRAAGAQAHREMRGKYPELTPENAEEAIRWQEARIKELTTGMISQ